MLFLSIVTKLDVFANAYEFFGDPCWEWLKILFGTPPVVDPQPIPLRIHQDIIHIPSDDDVDAANSPNQPIEIIDVDSNTHGTSYWNQVARYNDESDSENSPSIKIECSTSNPINLYGTPTKPFTPPSSGWSPWKN